MKGNFLMQDMATAGFVLFFNSTKFSAFISLDVAFSQFSLVCPKFMLYLVILASMSPNFLFIFSIS